MPLDALDQPNADPRYMDGIWLGLRMGTEEYLVGNATGVFKARSARQTPLDVAMDLRYHQSWDPLEAMQFHRR